MVREVISHPAVDYSEGMTAEEQKRYINYLAEHVREADLGLRARDAVLQDFLDKQREYDERLSKLDEVLSRVEGLEKELALEVKMRKSAERKVSELTARLRFADKDRFGDKNADIFIKYIEDLYELERQYTKSGLTDEERGKRR